MFERIVAIPDPTRLHRLARVSKLALPATIATEAVDRFKHHAQVMGADGDSYRFAQAATARGDVTDTTPLPSRDLGRLRSHRR